LEKAVEREKRKLTQRRKGAKVKRDAIRIADGLAGGTQDSRRLGFTQQSETGGDRYHIDRYHNSVVDN
jgi:hypothetical protein